MATGNSKNGNGAVVENTKSGVYEYPEDFRTRSRADDAQKDTREPYPNFV